MKSLKLIECRNVDNDVAETLLPTLSDKKMNEVIGGLSCALKYENGVVFCGKKYFLQVCAMDLSCGKSYYNGPTGCQSGYTNVGPCNGFSI